MKIKLSLSEAYFIKKSMETLISLSEELELKEDTDKLIAQDILNKLKK